MVLEEFTKLIEPSIAQMGYELVGVEFAQQGRGSLVRIYIDKPAGITIDDCERVSHQVSGILDVEDPIHGTYRLEVSSPGLDRPLFTIEHFKKYEGETVSLKTKSPIAGRRKFKGIIKSVTNEELTLLVDGHDVTLRFDSVDKANLVPKY